MLSDFKYAVRQLVQAPTFTLISILILALGIGMSTSAFSIMNGSLYHGMPFPDGSHLMRIFRVSADSEGPHSPGNYFDIKNSAKSFSSMAAFYTADINISEPGQPPIKTLGINATADFFSVIQVQPMLGRGFAPGEDKPGQDGVVVLTHAFWLRQFAGDQSVIGQKIHVGTEDRVIIGVMPEKFTEVPRWSEAGIIQPLPIYGNTPNTRSTRWFDIIARLRTGIKTDSAKIELDTISSRLDQDHPVENVNDRLKLTDFYSSESGESDKRVYWFISLLSGLVLTISCANLAGVQVARSLQRSHELAVRAAIGASRRRLLCPLLFESLLLALGGGLVGFLATIWYNTFLIKFAAPVDVHVVCFAFGASIISGIIFGLTPAWLNSRIPLNEALRQSSRSTTANRAHDRLKIILIIGQLALALVLVSIATSLSIAAKEAIARSLGWRPGTVFTAIAELPYQHFFDPKSRRVFNDRLRKNLGELPGVNNVVLATATPVFGYIERAYFIPDHASSLATGTEPFAFTASVDRDYFDLLKIPLLAGQSFSADLKSDGPMQVVINQKMAQKFWPGEMAVGKRFRLKDQTELREVVGVAGNVKMANMFTPPESAFQIYTPFPQADSVYTYLLVNSAQPTATLDRQIRKLIGDLDPSIVVDYSAPLSTHIQNMVAAYNPIVIALSSFALVGMVISLTGLFGVMSQFTKQQAPQIGIRMALGASQRSVIIPIVTRGARMVAVGIIVGLTGSVFISVACHRKLPELPLPDTSFQLLLALFLFVVAVAACFFPACRAASIDPVTALRAE